NGHEVRRGDQTVSLTPLEFDLLVLLARKPQQVFTREVRLEKVWGYQYKADTRLVNVHVQRLRAKIELDPDRPTIVTTVRGVGYSAEARTDNDLHETESLMKRTERRSRFTLALRSLRLRWLRLTQPVLGPFRARWRTSLMVRTMTITGLVTGFVVLVSGIYILTSVGDDLYTARRDQALQDSARATRAAQQLIDASDASDRSTLSTLAGSVRRTVQDTSASQMVYLRRQSGQ